MADIRVEIGSGSVYEQLGYKNHKEMETKSYLVMEINKAIKKKNLTQTKAARSGGIFEYIVQNLQGCLRLKKEEAISLVNEGKLHAVIVHLKNGTTYLRPEH